MERFTGNAGNVCVNVLTPLDRPKLLTIAHLLAAMVKSAFVWNTWTVVPLTLYCKKLGYPSQYLEL